MGRRKGQKNAFAAQPSGGPTHQNAFSGMQSQLGQGQPSPQNRGRYNAFSVLSNDNTPQRAEGSMANRVQYNASSRNAFSNTSGFTARTASQTMQSQTTPSHPLHATRNAFAATAFNQSFPQLEASTGFGDTNSGYCGQQQPFVSKNAFASVSASHGLQEAGRNDYAGFTGGQNVLQAPHNTAMRGNQNQFGSSLDNANYNQFSMLQTTSAYSQPPLRQPLQNAFSGSSVGQGMIRHGTPAFTSSAHSQGMMNNSTFPPIAPSNGTCSVQVPVAPSTMGGSFNSTSTPGSFASGNVVSDKELAVWIPDKFEKGKIPEVAPPREVC